MSRATILFVLSAFAIPQESTAGLFDRIHNRKTSCQPTCYVVQRCPSPTINENEEEPQVLMYEERTVKRSFMVPKTVVTRKLDENNKETISYTVEMVEVDREYTVRVPADATESVKQVFADLQADEKVRNSVAAANAVRDDATRELSDNSILDEFEKIEKDQEKQDGEIDKKQDKE